jgi:hypothetical protein
LLCFHFYLLGYLFVYLCLCCVHMSFYFLLLYLYLFCGVEELDPAGDGTYLSGVAGSCSALCGGDFSSSNASTGRCELTPCSNREARTGDTGFPCGDSGCFQRLFYLFLNWICIL